MAPAKVMVALGTRPEAIKTAPVIEGLRRHAPDIATCVVATAQHRSMLDEMLEIFGIVPDHDLDLMRPGQTLTEVTTRVLAGMERVIREERPDVVLVQGDTTTAFATGLAAFYQQVAVGHIEAGLRTGNRYNPFPEEANRRLLDSLSDLCFAPTHTARRMLLAEGIPDSRILVTGNTVIDTLLATTTRDHRTAIPQLSGLDAAGRSKLLLVTTHRRESFGAPLENVCLALRDLLEARLDLQVVLPVHLNPNVRTRVFELLGQAERAVLLEPLGYVEFVHLMKRADLILTDSGGVQEEAPSLDTPVLVIRETTERPDGIEAGAAKLIGTSRQRIVDEVLALLSDERAYARMQAAVNPYGDGQAARRTVDAVRHLLGLIDRPPEAMPELGSSAAAAGSSPGRRR